MIPADQIKNIDSNSDLKKFFFEYLKCSPIEKLDLSSNFKTLLPKVRSDYKILSKTLEKLTKDLFKIYQKTTNFPNISPQTDKIFFLEDDKYKKNEKGPDFKKMCTKVNKLLNRGSLTDEEANKVMSNINKAKNFDLYIEVSSADINNTIDCMEKGPITETRVMPGTNSASFVLEVDKKIFFSKNLKRKLSHNTIKKRSKNMSLAKQPSISLQKPKSRLKNRNSKSPNSLNS